MNVNVICRVLPPLLTTCIVATSLATAKNVFDVWFQRVSRFVPAAT